MNPGSSFWSYLRNDASSDEVHNKDHQRNLALEISKVSPAKGKHPLSTVVFAFEYTYTPEETKKFFVESNSCQDSIYTLENKQLGNVERSRLLKEIKTAVEEGKELGKESTGTRFNYDNSDPLVQACDFCLANKDFAFFKNLLITTINDESRYGKFSFALLSMVLNHPTLDDNTKSHFMLAIVQTKLSEPISDSDLSKEKPSLNATVTAMEKNKRYENRHHLRTLAMMSQLAGQRLAAEQKEQKSNAWFKDISKALSTAASLTTGPISPYGYVDPFSAITSGLLFKYSNGEQLSLASRKKIILLLTHELKEKINDPQLTKSERSVLKENRKLIKRRMAKRLNDLVNVHNNRTKNPKDLDYWYLEDYSHLKNLVHYTHALCEAKPSTSPMQIWRSSAEPEPQSSCAKKWSLNMLPYAFSLCSAAVSARNHIKDYINLEFISPEAAPYLILLFMFLAAASEKFAQHAQKTGIYLPSAVRSVAQTNESFIDRLTDSFKTKV